MLKTNFYWHLYRSIYIYIRLFTRICFTPNASTNTLWIVKTCSKHDSNMLNTVKPCACLVSFPLDEPSQACLWLYPVPPISLPPGASGWQRLGVVPIQRWHLVLPLPQIGIATSSSIQRGLWFTITNLWIWYDNQLDQLAKELLWFMGITCNKHTNNYKHLVGFEMFRGSRIRKWHG